jgi:hypothetical protein
MRILFPAVGQRGCLPCPFLYRTISVIAPSPLHPLARLLSSRRLCQRFLVKLSLDRRLLETTLKALDEDPDSRPRLIGFALLKPRSAVRRSTW